MNLFNKLKQKLGFAPTVQESTVQESQGVQYIIRYADALTMSQESQLVNHMISHFSSDCKPNSITVSSLSAHIKMTNACLTGEQLKKISDDTLAQVQSKANINSIELDGNIIWQKPAVHLGW